MHVMYIIQYNIACIATDVVSKISTFLKTTPLKYQVMAKLLDYQVIAYFNTTLIVIAFHSSINR